MKPKFTFTTAAICFSLLSGVASGADFTTLEAKVAKGELQAATFAGGCFWCMEPPFDKTKGVVRSMSGYSDGKTKNPTYRQVSAGGSGHVESVRIYFNPKKVSYKKLLDVFWKQIDPTDAGGQFVDRGDQYRSAIFFHDKSQQKLAQQSKKTLSKSGRFNKPLVTEISPLKKFFPAEVYHQGYYKKNPVRYKYYRHGSGRDQFLERVWKKPSDKK